MSFYDSPEGVDRYLERVADRDDPSHTQRLIDLLPEGAAVLELGMGPGRDFERLRQRFIALGTDASLEFLERYQDKRPRADLLQLDAVTLRTDRTFDGTFSNKVLHHLTRPQLEQSFARQADLLLPGGVAVHTLWYGATAPEEVDGMVHTLHTPDSLAALLPAGLKVEEAVRYTDVAADDSIRLVLRKPRAQARLQVTGSVKLD